MLEIILAVVIFIALFPLASMAMRIGAFAFAAFAYGCIHGGRFLLSLMFMTFSVQIMSLLIFEPFLNKFLKGVIFKGASLNLVVFLVALLTLILVLTFGRSSPFKLYGSLAVVLNIVLINFTIQVLYGYGSGLNFMQNTSGQGISLTATEAVAMYLTSINLSAFLFFGYDKFRAWIFPKTTNQDGRVQLPSLDYWSQKLARWMERNFPWMKPPRVPEWILHWHSILGGTIGAAFGQLLFRHKIKSAKFQPIYRKTFAVQVLLVVAIVFISYGT